MKSDRSVLSSVGALTMVLMMQPLNSAELRGAPAEMASLIKANTAFAVDLYGRLKDQDGNLFLSPYSISTALGMTYAGARDETAKAMADTLHFDEISRELYASFAGIEARVAEVQEEGHVQLSVANSLWPQRAFPLLPEFLDLSRKYFHAEITPLDFAQPAEASQTINTWVERQTQEKIKDLIPPGRLNASTRLVLVNAIYFKGDWAKPFDAERTRDLSFYTKPYQSALVPTMVRKGRFGYSDLGQVQVLDLPYAGGDLTFTAVLPKEKDGLAQIESELSSTLVESWLRGAPPRGVEVYLPKFRLTMEFDLGQQLAALGMGVAFSDQADFSGMNGKRDLAISAVLHKAFVEVTEEGTEAAAATAVGMRLTAAPSKPLVFRADHPFLFFIRDTRTGSILFMGRLTDPKN